MNFKVNIETCGDLGDDVANMKFLGLRNRDLGFMNHGKIKLDKKERLDLG